MVYADILYGVQLFFTHFYTIRASGETGYDETIDKIGSEKLLAALKR